MERFVLAPMILRGTRFVVTKGGEKLDLTWVDLAARFVLTDSDKLLLRRLSPGDILGIRDKPKKGRVLFYCSNTDRTGNVNWLLRKMPQALDGLIEAFVVESAVYDRHFTEFVPA